MKLFKALGDGIYECHVCEKHIKKMGRGAHGQMHVRKGEAIEQFNYPFASEYHVSFKGAAEKDQKR